MYMSAILGIDVGSIAMMGLSALTYSGGPDSPARTK